jgi:hypothetical protein
VVEVVGALGASPAAAPVEVDVVVCPAVGASLLGAGWSSPPLVGPGTVGGAAEEAATVAVVPSGRAGGSPNARYAHQPPATATMATSPTVIALRPRLGSGAGRDRIGRVA